MGASVLNLWYRCRLPWCHGTVVTSFLGTLVLRFHDGFPAMSGPISCSITFSKRSLPHSVLKAWKGKQIYHEIEIFSVYNAYHTIRMEVVVSATIHLYRRSTLFRVIKYIIIIYIQATVYTNVQRGFINNLNNDTKHWIEEFNWEQFTSGTAPIFAHMMLAPGKSCSILVILASNPYSLCKSERESFTV